MGWLSEILGRPEHEKPFILFPVGYLAGLVQVPEIKRKPLEEIAIWKIQAEGIAGDWILQKSGSVSVWIVQQSCQVLDAPQLFRDACMHCRRNAQRRVDSHEVVEHKMKRNRMRMVLNFLREGICQSGKPTHVHSHSQVLTFNVTGRDIFALWMA